MKYYCCKTYLSSRYNSLQVMKLSCFNENFDFRYASLQTMKRWVFLGRMSKYAPGFLSEWLNVIGATKIHSL